MALAVPRRDLVMTPAAYQVGDSGVAMAEEGTSSSEYLLQEKQQQPVAFGAPPPQQQQPVIQVQPRRINKDAI